jgi:hypothetical protein
MPLRVASVLSAVLHDSGVAQRDNADGASSLFRTGARPTWIFSTAAGARLPARELWYVYRLVSTIRLRPPLSESSRTAAVLKFRLLPLRARIG